MLRRRLPRAARHCTSCSSANFPEIIAPAKKVAPKSGNRQANDCQKQPHLSEPARRTMAVPGGCRAIRGAGERE
jgi:hypothetical protein